MSAVEGWKIESLGWVAQITMGQSPDSKYYSEEKNGLPFLQGCAEFTGRFPKHALYCSQTKKVANTGSILFSVRAPVGKINVADCDYIIGRGLAAISGIEVDQTYLEHYLKHVESKFRNASQGSTFEAINSSELNRWPIEHPISKPEQAKIAEILSTVERAIEQTGALIVKQQRIKTGLMQDLLTRGIDEHGNLRSELTHQFKDSPLGRIPVEWEVELLDVLAARGSGHTPSKSRTEYWNGGIKWVSLADSSKLDQVLIEDTDKEISDLGLKNSSAIMHAKGTVILSRDAGVGKSAILGENMAVSQHFMAWRCKPEKLDNYYLYYWLRKDKLKFEGIASGSTIVTIGLQFFKGYAIAAPKRVLEQEKISKILYSTDDALKRSTADLGKLRQLKTALMQDLLTGRTRVTPILEKAARL
jgi:type I restriction enzyme S subunit